MYDRGKLGKGNWNKVPVQAMISEADSVVVHN